MYIPILTKENPTVLKAPPNGVPLLLVKFIVAFISTLVLIILIHPPMFESNWLTPRKVNGRRRVVMTPLVPNRNEFEPVAPSFMFSLNWLRKVYIKHCITKAKLTNFLLL